MAVVRQLNQGLFCELNEKRKNQGVMILVAAFCVEKLEGVVCCFVQFNTGTRPNQLCSRAPPVCLAWGLALGRKLTCKNEDPDYIILLSSIHVKVV